MDFFKNEIGEDIAVGFYSIKRFYQKEREGLKPNTQRLMRHLEYVRLELMFKHTRPCGITITERPTDGINAIFRRNITDITILGDFLNQYLVNISWEHED